MTTVWAGIVAASERHGEIKEQDEPATCTWVADELTGRFSAKPKIYGGTRLGYTVEIHTPDPGPGLMLDVRESVATTLAEIKTNAEAACSPQPSSAEDSERRDGSAT